MTSLTGLDSILALDVLRTLAEEGVRVVITYERDAKIYRIDLEGGIFGDDETWTTGVTFGDAVETALDYFREAVVGSGAIVSEADATGNGPEATA